MGESGLFGYEWWISVIVSGGIIGILVNLTSAYLKTYLDKLLNRFSERRRRSSEEKKQRIAAEVQELLQNPDRVTSLKLHTIRRSSELAMAMVWGLLVMSLAQALGDYGERGGLALTNELRLVGLLVGFGIAMASSRSLNLLSDERKVLDEYEKVKRQKEIEELKKIRDDNEQRRKELGKAENTP